ncbi:MAG: DNA-deoxyinosine glycosylase [bacterium]|nr:DNA-deoxyinosine glycosylase [bacterium]MCM1375820.1 DNA-deoxyinosine glycosylase [Muribaculum sp.]
MAKYEQVTQPFAPVYDSNSRILILGSLPSVKSREQGFYYGHARNRFWPMLAAVYREPAPDDIPAKKALLLRHGLAVYDVIESCEIRGSSDSSIRNVKAADIRVIMEAARIERILANGRTAAKYFKAYQPAAYQPLLMELPSTSPANAAFSLEKLVRIWEECLR